MRIITNFYTGRSWGNANNYDLCINSASYGIDGTVDFILRMIGRDKDKKNRNDPQMKCAAGLFAGHDKL